MSTLLTRQFQKYIDEDPPPNQKAPLPLSVYNDIQKKCKTSRSQFQIATCQLIIIALFFAMRSCEYTKTPSSEETKTKQIQVGDIKFYNKNRKVIKHNAKDIRKRATLVAILFRSQKNREKFELVSHEKSDSHICSVGTLIDLVQRLWSYPGTTDETYIDTFYCKTLDKLGHVTSKMVTEELKKAVIKVGNDNLGISVKEVGTHSIRTSFAMLMHLNGAPDSTIKIKGRWKSDAFMKYIRGYIDMFGGNASKLITNKMNGHFVSLLKQ